MTIDSDHILLNDFDEQHEGAGSSNNGDEIFVTETEFDDGDEAQYLETDEGTVKLVQIRIPNSDGNDNLTWVEMVDEPE